MLFFYNLFFPLVFLFYLPGLIVKYIRRSGYKATYRERFGIFGAARRRELKEWRGAVWLHAVSVGETNLTLPLLKAWAEAEPDLAQQYGGAEKIRTLEAQAEWLETTGIEKCFDLHGAEPNNAE